MTKRIVFAPSVRRRLAAAVVLMMCAGGLAVAAAWAEDPRWNQLAPFFTVPAEFDREDPRYVSTWKFANGQSVKTPEDWQRRRAEILKTWHELLGPWPPLITEPKFEEVERVAGDGFDRHTIRFALTPNETTSAYLLIPHGAQARPAVLVVSYEPETAVGLKGEHRDFALQLARRGFVTLSVGHDASIYYPSRDRAELQPLSALAYAAANAYYVLASRPEVDSQRIGIAGHSYGGKWAMFASCLFDKFACAAWSDGGIVFDETRPNVNYWEPWYLGYEGPEFRQRGVPTDERPRTGLYRRLVAEHRDLHELHALMAPRPFLVSGGSEDPPERWLALRPTVEVNRLLGYEHRVGMTNRPSHSPTPESNEQMYRFFEHFLKPQ